MESDPKFHAVPKGQENTLLLVSTAFLGLIFAIIGSFIFKLWYDEKKARRNREAYAELDDLGDVVAGNEGSRNRRTNRVSDSLQDGDYSEFQPGRRDDEEDSSDQEDGYGNDRARDPFGKKIGKKKLAKLQAKAEARVEREQMLAQRAEQKKRDERLQKEREEAEQAEAERQRQEAEEENKRREEKARQEYEEYLKMKEQFSVTNEGFDQVEESEAENLMAAFLEHIKTNKVVNVDDLAAMFKLKVDETVDRLRHFVSTEQLTGVIDDRGKFIYITEDELQSVAQFISQRGRVKLSELVDYSNQLISLEPVSGGS